VGIVRMKTPLEEMRIAAVYRGAGPRNLPEKKWDSFDGLLLQRAAAKGAQVVRDHVDQVALNDGRPEVKARHGTPQSYDLLVVASGVNSSLLKSLAGLGLSYRPPTTARTYISEFYLGEETIVKYLGHAMHVFLLNLPRLEFAALIPKGDYVTFCLLGKNIDDALVDSFLNSSEVKQCMPPGWRRPDKACHCSPWMSLGDARHPFADRVVFLGDCGVGRLYKDGIGSAYRTAKAAARTAIFEGIGARDFQRLFWPVCRGIRRDNLFGEMVFMVTRQIQRHAFARRGLLRMVSREQLQTSGTRHMSMVLWDTFTGSASYANVFFRTFHPGFWGRLIGNILLSLRRSRRA